MSIPRPRITYLTTRLSHGGAEHQLLQITTRLKQRGWDVRVISMRTPVALLESFAAEAIPVESLAMESKAKLLPAAARLVRLLRRAQPHVLHCHMVHANITGRLTRPLTRVPVLVSAARNINEGPRWREYAYRLTDRFSDITTQVSRAGAERYVRIGAVPAHKMRVIPNGVDTLRYLPDAALPDAALREAVRRELGLEGRFVWLTVGRFDPQKDYGNLLGAFERVIGGSGDRGIGGPGRGPSTASFPPRGRDFARDDKARGARDDIRQRATLLIAGDGRLRGEMEQRAREMGIAKGVRFLGIREDVPQLMQAADAFVLASAWEGMSNVLLEASASGLPIVATDVGGNAEVVVGGNQVIKESSDRGIGKLGRDPSATLRCGRDDKEGNAGKPARDDRAATGFLVPPKDPLALAEAMARMMVLPEAERTRMGAAGRTYIDARYDIERVVDQWEALYLELLAKRGISYQ